MDFDQFLALLPVIREQPRIVGRDSVRYVLEENPYFVSPLLEEMQPVVESGTSVVLLSAPAAVGKSTVAAEVARRTGAPLWDLARFQVGTGTYLGALGTAFGMSALGDVVQALSAGQFLVVFDALDEALLRAGEKNFEAFLEDISEASGPTRERPAILLLARAETAELIAMYLEDRPFAWFQIAFFDEQSASEFIDKRLDLMFDGQAKARAHRVHREPFTLARRRLFGLVFDLLGVDDPSPWTAEWARSFVGYAPVLEAIAAYLFFDNYGELANRLEAARETLPDRGPGQLWSFLVRIVDELLRREQDKIAGGLREQLEPRAMSVGWDSWEDVYTPDEQCVRVLASLFPGIELGVLPPSLPIELRDAYEGALRPSVPEHPFRGVEHGGFANIVFREYLFAWHLALGTEGQRQIVRDRMTKPDYLPSPLLGRFLLALAGNGEEPKIDAADLPFLYESLRSQVRTEGELHLVLDEDPAGGFIHGTVSSGRSGHPDIGFGVLPGGAGIGFLRRLSHAVLSVACDVSLGADGGGFVLGPGVDIECRVLRTVAATVRVPTQPANSDDSPEAGDVVIEAESFEYAAAPPELSVFPPGRLRVRGQSVIHPWVQYAMPQVPLDPLDDDLLEPNLYLSRILVRFRGSASYEGLCRGQIYIDNVVVGDSAVAAALLEFLIDEKGLVQRKGGLYCLDLRRMRNLGINWADVRGRVLADGVRELLKEFVAYVG